MKSGQDLNVRGVYREAVCTRLDDVYLQRLSTLLTIVGFGISIVMALASMIIIPWLIVKMPADYFLSSPS